MPHVMATALLKKNIGLIQWYSINIFFLREETHPLKVRWAPDTKIEPTTFG